MTRSLPCDIRPLRWPEDLAGLAALDTSYTTDRVLRVTVGEDAVTLEEVPVSPPLRKSFPLNLERAEVVSGLALVAAAEGGRAGVASVVYHAWNRRAELRHLYVAPAWRRRGLGRDLLERAAAWAREQGARGLWLETQDVNPGAVAFYRAAGFRLCGLDSSLYDPAGPAAGETALFFYLPLGARTPGSASEELPA